VKVLAVLGHPSADSYCAAVFNSVVRELEKSHDVTAVRLAEENFRPTMSAVERRAYETSTPLVEDATRRHAAALRTAEALVFVYPTWWSGLPAQLKGWLERVFVVGVAFRFNNRGKIRPNLQNVRHIIGVSTYGSPWRYVKLINDNGRRTLTRAIRTSTGMRARTMWCGLYALDTCTLEQRRDFIAETTKKISRRLGQKSS